MTGPDALHIRGEATLRGVHGTCQPYCSHARQTQSFQEHRELAKGLGPTVAVTPRLQGKTLPAWSHTLQLFAHAALALQLLRDISTKDSFGERLGRNRMAMPSASKYRELLVGTAISKLPISLTLFDPLPSVLLPVHSLAAVRHVPQKSRYPASSVLRKLQAFLRRASCRPWPAAVCPKIIKIGRASYRERVFARV